MYVFRRHNGKVSRREFCSEVRRQKKRSRLRIGLVVHIICFFPLNIKILGVGTGQVVPKKNNKNPVSLGARFSGAVIVVTIYDITLKNTTGNGAGGKWGGLIAFVRAYCTGTQGTPSPSPRPDYGFALIILRSAMGRVDDNFHVVDSDVILIKKKLITACL